MMSIHPPHMKNSPSAFIPFCEYNGDMIAVGEFIESFPYPVCNAFKPSLITGEICYTFDPSTIQSNITSDKPYITFLLDYNEDREYTTFKTREFENVKEPESLNEMEEYDARKNDALIYIHTLGNFFFL